MNYQTFQPNADIASLVKCYWTLEVPYAPDHEKQRIVPDGCLELIFMLGDDIRRYTSETDSVIQPRAFVVGQITEPFVIEPTGYVNCFATRFYPYGFANFVTKPINDLANKETPIAELFGETPAHELEQKILAATDTSERIRIVEAFLSGLLNRETTIDQIVRSSINLLFSSNGSLPIHALFSKNPQQRRQLERKFMKQIGLSPKQLGKVIRLQTALNMMVNQKAETLSQIAYESEYYDQAHFIKDFKEFTGINPKEFLSDEKMALSTLFYTSA
jgi:AraC-like DNA-binding protein